MPYAFNMTDNEWKQIVEWEKKHDTECPIILKHKDPNSPTYDIYQSEFASPYGAIAGGRTYCFTPTSIGMFISVKCCCNASFTCDSNL